MNKEIVEKLSALSPEEAEILDGQQNIRKDAYTFSDKFIVNSKKLLGGGKQIDLRPHTRFIDFPEHGHDYMEFMYVYSGSITHFIGTEKIVLERGDILFLNKHARHSIRRAEKTDIGINFILSNSFLQYIFHNVENNPVMSGFLTRNFDPDGEAEYLFFKTADCFPILNLMDNLIYAIVNHTPDDYTISTQLVSLLFSYLSYYKETLANRSGALSDTALLTQQISTYIREHYPQASLKELSEQVGYNSVYLSRKIHAAFGKTFQELVQEERLLVAEKLLRTTQLTVDEIIRTVGYENQTHFHTLFKKKYGTTPYRYKLSAQQR